MYAFVVGDNADELDIAIGIDEANGTGNRGVVLETDRAARSFLFGMECGIGQATQNA